MSDDSHDDSQHRRPHTPPMAASFLEFDLTRELEQLHGEPEWNRGQNAKTLVKYDDFRVVLMALKAHARLPGHQTKGRISIQTVAGHLLVRAEGRTFDLPTGTLLALDQDLPHDVEALDESAFLLTIAWPGGDGSLAR
jgi:quercetin dioxygenase-like cupin family protein